MSTPQNIISLKNTSLEFNSSPAGEETICSLDNNPYLTCLSPLAFSNLAEGPHSLVIKFNNPTASNTVLTHSWTVDTTPPLIQIKIHHLIF